MKIGDNYLQVWLSHRFYDPWNILSSLYSEQLYFLALLSSLYYPRFQDICKKMLNLYYEFIVI